MSTETDEHNGEIKKLVNEMAGENIHAKELIHTYFSLLYISMQKLYNDNTKTSEEKNTLYNLELYNTFKKYTDKINEVEINENNILSTLNIHNLFYKSSMPSNSNLPIVNYYLMYNLDKNMRATQQSMMAITLTLCFYYFLKHVDQNTLNNEMFNEVIGKFLSSFCLCKIHNNFSNDDLVRILKYLHENENDEKYGTSVKKIINVFEPDGFMCIIS